MDINKYLQISKIKNPRLKQGGDGVVVNQNNLKLSLFSAQGGCKSYREIITLSHFLINISAMTSKNKFYFVNIYKLKNNPPLAIYSERIKPN